jgi:hypothetical protein
MSERSERLDFAGHECVVSSADGVSTHAEDGSSRLTYDASTRDPPMSEAFARGRGSAWIALWRPAPLLGYQT